MHTPHPISRDTESFPTPPASAHRPRFGDPRSVRTQGQRTDTLSRECEWLRLVHKLAHA